MSTKKKISVVIVNYNSTKRLLDLINSLKHIDQIIEEIIIIDNHSNDFTHQLNNLKIKVKVNSQNLGFSKAVNQGIVLSSTNYILMLNPDTLLIDNSIIKIFNYLKKNNKIGAIGGRILDQRDRSIRYTANYKPTFATGLFEFTNLKKIFPNNYITNKFWVESQKNINNPTEVDALCGAFILFKKCTNGLNLRFDEDYFLYLEDLQFGLDIKKKGLKVIFYPDSQVLHLGGGSNSSRYGVVLNKWYESRKIFFHKNFSKIESFILKNVFTLEEKLLFLYHKIKNQPNE